MHRRRSGSLPWAGALALLFIHESALADEGEWLVTAEAAGALFSGGAGPSFGGGGELAVATGLTDMFWLGLAGGVTGLQEGPLRGYGLGQFSLLFDVFRTVPFLDLGLGVDTYAGRSSPLFRIGAGADYLVSSSWALGMVVRYQPALTDPLEHLFSLGLRLVWRGPD